MQKLEITLGCAFLLGIILMIWDISEWFVLMKLSSTTLSLIYFFFSYILLNPVKIGDSNTYFVGIYRTFVSILIGCAFSMFIIGVFAILTGWLGAFLFSVIGFVLIIVCCVILLLGKKLHKEFVSTCFKRIFIMICIGLIAFMMNYFRIGDIPR